MSNNELAVLQAEVDQLRAEVEEKRAEVAKHQQRNDLIMQAYWNFVNADPGHVVETLENFQNVLRQEVVNG